MNDKNLSDELIKQDGIDPSGISDKERSDFKAMLEAEQRRVNRMAWTVQIPSWVFAVSLLTLCLSERLIEELHIPFVVAWGVLMIVLFVILVPLSFRSLSRFKLRKAKLIRLQQLLPEYKDKWAEGVLMSLVLVGRKDGRRIVVWPSVIILGIAILLIITLGGEGVFYLLCGRWSGLVVAISVFNSMVFMMVAVHQGLKTPITELTELQAGGPNTWRMIMKNKITKFAIAAIVVVVAAVAIHLFIPRTTSKEISSKEAIRIVEAHKAITQLVPLDIKLPQPMFEGTPTNIQVPNREEPLGRPRPPFMAPVGTKNISLGKPVTASEQYPIIGEIEMITDGDKEAADGCYVELGRLKQYVTIDLGGQYEIYAIVMWHFHKEARVYFDVVVQVADDPDFAANVRTVFNNDYDNSAGLGIGKNMHYVETNEGKLIDAKGIHGRYVRLYSNGNNANELNHYIEVEVYGRAILQ